VNLTLSLLTGLLLLLPGLTAVVTWNARSTRAGARRPDLTLTALSALFAALAISAAIHAAGYLMGEIAVRMTQELQLDSLFTAPYPTMIKLMLSDHPDAQPLALFEFLLTTAIGSVAAWRIVTSDGLTLTFPQSDLRGQGWIFEHIVRPHANGYIPIAYVMTCMTHNSLGVGYQGPIAEVRQGDDGKIKAIAISSPERFLYELREGNAASPLFGLARGNPSLENRVRQWVGGIVVLDADVIRNIVVHNLSYAELDSRRRRA
jgi:hypothetical protein